VFVVHRGHDSGNTSAGLIAGGRRWFVKWATGPEAVRHLRSAVRFHDAVTHPAIVALRSWFTVPSGLAQVHDWVPGEVLNDSLVPGGLPGRTRGRRSPGSGGCLRPRCSRPAARSLMPTAWPPDAGSRPWISTMAA
jgi:hypothetical protein